MNIINISILLRASLHATIAFLLLLILRILTNKLSKKYTRYLMIGVFGSLLLSPFLKSSFSMVNIAQKTVDNNSFSHVIRLVNEKNIIGIISSNNESYGIFSSIFFVIWIIGICIILLNVIINYLNIKKHLLFAMKIHDNIYECEDIQAPFILGIINPRIYLPITLNETQRSIIINHEKIHIKYYDYLIKPLCLLILIIHWFNPVVWLSYKMLSNDLEAACDELTIDTYNDDKDSYIDALMSLSRVNTFVTFISFEGNNVKERIKNLLNYNGQKRPVLMSLSILFSVILSLFIILSYKQGTSVIKGETFSVNDPVNNIKVICEYECYYNKETIDLINTIDKNGDVYPLNDGVVESIGYDNINGNYLYIIHGNGYRSFYSGLEKINVSKDEKVNINSSLGNIGHTGTLKKGNHLSIALFDENGNYIKNLSEFFTK